MNGRVIGLLSLFGAAMAVATVYVIPPSVEPLLWLGIFVFCAYVLARSVRQQAFLHGLAIGVLNSVWITVAHVLLFNDYIARHPREAAMSASMPLASHPRVMMAIVGPVIGVISGTVLGLFAMIAFRVLRKGRA